MSKAEKTAVGARVSAEYDMLSFQQPTSYISRNAQADPERWQDGLREMTASDPDKLREIMAVALSGGGFTLIEMSIVLVIIGLIVGGVLVGQSLINAAATRHVITEKQQFETAALVFRNQYGYMPGDFPGAAALWPSSSCAASNICNGNGNGVIDSGTESCQFWEHLSLAGLLQNQNLTPLFDHTGRCASQEVPVSAYSSTASWMMTYCEPGNATTCAQGQNYLELTTGIIYGTTMHGGQGGAAIRPGNAQMIDQKIDDGLPITGAVQADNNEAGYAQSAPWAPSKRYCLFSADAVNWSYYTGYNGDAFGCMLVFQFKY